MAEVLSFHHQSGSSVLHRSDARLKFLLFVLFNLLLATASLPVSLVAFISLTVAAVLLHIPILRIAGELKNLIWIFLITYISRAHLSGGASLEIAAAQSIRLGNLTWPTNDLYIAWNPAGAWETLNFIIKISTAILSTHMFMHSTSMRELQEAVYRLLRPLSRSFAWQLSTMLRIMLQAIPRLMDVSKGVSLSLHMRALNPKRHPIVYARSLSLALLRSLHNLSEQYSRALAIRAWRVDGPAQLHPLPMDRKANVLVLLIAAFLLMLAQMPVWLLP